MELFKHNTNISFMGTKARTFSAIVSLLCVISTMILLSTKGINYGLDFTGGTQLEMRFENAIDTSTVRDILQKGGYEGKVTHYGAMQDIMVKIPNKEGVSEKEIGPKVAKVLADGGQKVELRRVEFVGSEVGEMVTQQGILAVMVALLGTMVYVALRFEWRLAVSAAVALIHDPILILGIFSLFQIEFDLAGLAAILAVLGYSINDTIVVFDRVRENFRKIRKGTALEIMNISINQTLSRTIMTSALTLSVVVVLYFFGGESLKGFSLALIIGIVFGTYSSIYIAGALAILMGLSKEDLIIRPKVIEEG